MTPPRSAGESKKAFAASSVRSGIGYSIPKSCITQREEPRLQEAEQAMQETENSVLLEACRYDTLSGLTQAPGKAGGLSSETPPAVLWRVKKLWLPASSETGRDEQLYDCQKDNLG